MGHITLKLFTNGSSKGVNWFGSYVIISYFYYKVTSISGYFYSISGNQIQSAKNEVLSAKIHFYQRFHPSNQRI
ncbi:hypothetical protein SAMN05518684_11446 [Salipaludibacillus aurantiacus]|uniref:Uncharacterized protein n=1 Tax=Salipaludibacillus aurantiacus TaxID=1601833 RepID=A0A1H9W407_9BACI|nr:hypothetical protein SAMN05518684_11446 [Salipaludibacillus aurantiacus]